MDMIINMVGLVLLAIVTVIFAIAEVIEGAVDLFLIPVLWIITRFMRLSAWVMNQPKRS